MFPNWRRYFQWNWYGKPLRRTWSLLRV